VLIKLKNNIYFVLASHFSEFLGVQLSKAKFEATKEAVSNAVLLFQNCFFAAQQVGLEVARILDIRVKSQPPSVTAEDHGSAVKQIEEHIEERVKEQSLLPVEHEQENQDGSWIKKNHFLCFSLFFFQSRYSPALFP
jgi:hypothetical protein